MEKKKFTSWGVSFFSLALVGGMVSYLELTNKDTANALSKSNQSPAVSHNTIQQTPSQNGDNVNSSGSSADDNGTSSSLENGQAANNDGNSSSLGNGQAANNNGSSFSSGNNYSQPALNAGSSGQSASQFSGGGFGHHRGLDTTTRGS